MLLLNIFYQGGFSYWFVEVKRFDFKANVRSNEEGSKDRKGPRRGRGFRSQKKKEDVVLDPKLLALYIAYKAQVLSDIPSDFMVIPKSDRIIFFKEQDGPLVPAIPLNSAISAVLNFFSKKNKTRENWEEKLRFEDTNVSNPTEICEDGISYKVTPRCIRDYSTANGFPGWPGVFRP